MDFVDCGGLFGTYRAQRYRPLQFKPFALDGPTKLSARRHGKSAAAGRAMVTKKNNSSHRRFNPLYSLLI
jgi:hypothetical protein